MFLAGEQLQLAARVRQLRARGRGLGQRGGLALGAHLQLQQQGIFFLIDGPIGL